MSPLVRVGGTLIPIKDCWHKPKFSVSGKDRINSSSVVGLGSRV